MIKSIIKDFDFNDKILFLFKYIFISFGSIFFIGIIVYLFLNIFSFSFNQLAINYFINLLINSLFIISISVFISTIFSFFNSIFLITFDNMIKKFILKLIKLISFLPLFIFLMLAINLTTLFHNNYVIMIMVLSLMLIPYQTLKYYNHIKLKKHEYYISAINLGIEDNLLLTKLIIPSSINKLIYVTIDVFIISFIITTPFIYTLFSLESSVYLINVYIYNDLINGTMSNISIVSILFILITLFLIRFIQSKLESNELQN